jgi:hypothetical protein
MTRSQSEARHSPTTIMHRLYMKAKLTDRFGAIMVYISCLPMPFETGFAELSSVGLSSEVMPGNVVWENFVLGRQIVSG